MFTRFLQERKGSVLPIFAIAIIPIIGFVGVAVDFSRAGSARAEMQAALDGTALMLSKDAPKLNSTDLQARATEYFNSMFTRPEASNLTVTPTYNVSDSTYTLKVTAAGSIEGTFSRVIGVNSFGIGGSSEVTWGIKRLELALALDNTGSMSSNNKMTELKKAAKGLLTTLQTAAKSPDDIKVSIIPFATDVNVGKSNKDANWLNWAEWNEANGTCKDYENWQGDGNGPSNKDACQNYNGKWKKAEHDDWNGCVTDREKDHDVLDTAPKNKETDFVTHQATSCPVELLPLTNVWADLNSKVDSMTPTGNTNVTIGLAWAWHSLTARQPLNQAAAPKEDLDKVIILLTDGDNTQNRWSSVQSEIDERTKKACENVKAANIKLYTVRVINGNADLLQTCASGPDMFYDVQSASQLNAVFKGIATNLANLRIAK